MPNKTPATNKNNIEFQHVLIKAILESSPDGILVVDDQGYIASYNHRFIEIWELALKHQTLHINIGDKDNPILSMVAQRVRHTNAFLARVKELYEHPELKDHCELELKDGRTLERYSTVLWGDNHQYMGRVWFFRDITSHKKIETTLLELTRHDPLTSIANRRYFFEHSMQEFLRSKRHQIPLCVASIDIDHFKQINDNYGHAAGDEMLKAVCSIILNMLRKTEFLARIGGEEFAILLPDIQLEGAIHLAERIRQVVENNTITINEQEISCTVSIGIAELNPADASIENCLSRADKALYQAKKNGRNRIES